MISIDVQGDARRATLMLSSFRGGIARATARALNRTGVTVRAAASRAVARDSGLRVTEVKKRILLRRATKSVLVARIEARGGVTLPLMLFRPRQTASGVTVSIGARVVAIAHAFIKPAGGRPAGVYLRTMPGAAEQRRPGGVLYTNAEGAYRRSRRQGIRAVNGMDLPISQLRAEGVPLWFMKTAVSGALQQIARERFAIVMQQELRFEVARLSGGDGGQ